MPKKQVSASVEEMSRVKSFIDSKFISEAKQEEALSVLNFIYMYPSLKDVLELLIKMYNLLIEKDFTLLYQDENRLMVRHILDIWYEDIQFQVHTNMSEEMRGLKIKIFDLAKKVWKIYLFRE